MVCDGKWFETISERLVENKTDNKYYYDGGRIPMDGQIFVLDTCGGGNLTKHYFGRIRLRV
jgi:hypothetical protein